LAHVSTFHAPQLLVTCQSPQLLLDTICCDDFFYSHPTVDPFLGLGRAGNNSTQEKNSSNIEHKQLHCEQGTDCCGHPTIKAVTRAFASLVEQAAP